MKHSPEYAYCHLLKGENVALFIIQTAATAQSKHTQGEKDNTVIIGSKLDAQAYDIQISEIN